MKGTGRSLHVILKPASHTQGSRSEVGGASGLADVLTVVLDKGIVVDVWDAIVNAIRRWIVEAIVNRVRQWFQSLFDRFISRVLPGTWSVNIQSS